MGTKPSKEDLPLLQEQCHEFVIYSNETLYGLIGQLFDHVDTYVEYENHVTLFRYKTHLIKMVSSNAIDYIRSRSVPIILSYDSTDRMSWYNALNSKKGIENRVVLISYCSSSYRRKSVSLLDLHVCQLDVEHYEIESNDTIKSIISLIIEKHILNTDVLP